MRLSPLIIAVSFGVACTDHGLKIHEDTHREVASKYIEEGKIGC